MRGYELLIQYLTAIATNHVSILHTPEKPRFFCVDLEEVISRERNLSFDNQCLVLPNVVFKTVDNGSQIRQEMDVMLFVLGYSPNNDFEKEKQVTIDTEKTAISIINRMKADSITGHALFYGSQNKLDVSLTQSKFPTSLNSRGWQINLKITPFMNKCVENDDWADLPVIP
jgi:hypothetical protein